MNKPKYAVILASNKKEAIAIAKREYKKAIYLRPYRYASKGNNFYEFQINQGFRPRTPSRRGKIKTYLTMKNNNELSPIEKVRRIVELSNWMNEYFNFRVRSFVDFEKLYDYCQENDIEFCDQFPYDFMTKKENKQHIRAINKLVGYRLLQTI